MIGLVQLATLTLQGGSWWDDRPLRKAAGCVGVFLALWMAQHSLVKTMAVDHEVNVLYPHETDYFAWARQVSKAIPEGSSVLISIIPDPYFVLRERKDLSLREFIPGLKLDQRAVTDYMMGADFVLARGPVPSKEVWSFVQAHARLVMQVGNSSGGGYYVRSLKVIKN